MDDVRSGAIPFAGNGIGGVRVPLPLPATVRAIRVWIDGVLFSSRLAPIPVGPP